MSLPCLYSPFDECSYDCEGCTRCHNYEEELDFYDSQDPYHEMIDDMLTGQFEEEE